MAVCKCGSYRRHLLMDDAENVVGYACPECGAEWHQSPPDPTPGIVVLEQGPDEDYPRYE